MAIFWGDPEVSLILQSLGFTWERASTSFLLPTQMSVQQRGIQGVVGARERSGKTAYSGTLFGICGCQLHFIEQIFTKSRALED